MKREKGQDKEVTFLVRQKNVISLISSDRVEELIREVEGCRWDALLIRETWRSEKAEIWETRQGHTNMGAGKVENKHGVGMLLIVKWRKRINLTDYINEGAIATSNRVNKQRVLLMSVCFFHTVYADHHVEKGMQSNRETHEIQGGNSDRGW